MDRTRLARALASGVAVALLVWGLATPADAEPTPAPSAPSEAAATGTATPPAEVSPAPTDGSAAPSTPAVPSTPPATPGGPATPTASPRAAQQAEADPGTPLTLTVSSEGGPVAGAYYEDLGSFALAGTSTLPDASTVTLERQAGSGWTTVATTAVRGGAYATTLPVQAAGPATFRARAAGTEGATLTSTPTTVTVKDSTLSARPAAAKVDALKPVIVRGAVVPARGGVNVVVDVRNGSRWSKTTTATTKADGTYAASVTHGKGQLKRYTFRTAFRAENRPRWERSTELGVTRIAVLDAQVDATSKADVAKTYRKGCPVGRSKLTTIHLNHYGYDKRMHRGVFIIRTDLRQEIIRAFGSALEHRYPIDKMNNPNVYGGNDPRQMEANNTSGFNCRKVVGNPYKMSPHSYGIALDVNTVQNPYRDVKGKWWPSNGKKYRDRTPLKKGMLGKGSWLTKSLRKDDFFWGGLWNPGRDYQHFEYRG